MENSSNIPYVVLFILRVTSVVDSLTVLIAHNSDMFSQIDQFKGGVIGESIGGFARTLYAIRECRREATTKGTLCLYMNAGGTLTGSLWYTALGWEVIARFMKIIQPDVMALGVHDFDDSVQNLSNYIRAVGCPVVCANADFSQEPALAGLIEPYHVFNIDGVAIGVVGYITPTVARFGKTGLVKFKSELSALMEVTKEMKNRGIKMIIALGYSGFTMDVVLAKKLKDVQIVIGGMSNTVLWTGPKPGPDTPLESYPKIVKRGTSKALVLHVGGYTKYLGMIDLRYNRRGKIIKYSTNVAYLRSYYPQEKQIREAMEEYTPKVEELEQSVVGRSRVFLSGLCSIAECNFGNLIADAFVDYVASNSNLTPSGYWSNAGIALFNGGDIKVNLEAGNITLGQLHEAVPIDQYLTIYTINGAKLLNYLEQTIRSEFLPELGAFPQVSGLSVHINSDIKIGNRIMTVKVRCIKCDYPYFVNLVRRNWYTVITTDNLLGKDTSVRISVKEKHPLGVRIWDVVAQYLKKKKIVRPEIEERFRYREK